MEIGINEWIIIMSLIFAFVIISRFVAGRQDSKRISNYIRQRGGRLISQVWAPFGTGWQGSEDSRIYEIVYTDRNGMRRNATVKTSMWGGVYFTGDDAVGGRLPETSEKKRLRLENERLKKELGRLRKK